MPQRARLLHDEWKKADDLARDAERLLIQVWDRYFKGEGEPPDENTLEIVRDLRDKASAKLDLLMEYMRVTAAGR